MRTKIMLRMRVLLVLLCCILFAGNAMADGFTIRNGLKWGDSPETVLKSEGIASFTDEYTNDWQDASIKRKALNKIMAGGHLVDAIFGFKNGKLACVEYDISPSYFNEILSALLAKYGKSYSFDFIKNTVAFERAMKLYTQYYGGGTAVVLSIRLDNWWILDDGTIIAACSGHMYGNNCYVIYFDSSAFDTVAEHNFSGL